MRLGAFKRFKAATQQFKRNKAFQMAKVIKNIEIGLSSLHLFLPIIIITRKKGMCAAYCVFL